jgi:hypothetical protein
MTAAGLARKMSGAAVAPLHCDAPSSSSSSSSATHSIYCIVAEQMSDISDAACRHLCCQVNTLESGEIDYDDLKARLAANNSRPAIINVNIGTTVKGAVDDLDRVLDILTETGYTEDRCVAAYCGCLSSTLHLSIDAVAADAV